MTRQITPPISAAAERMRRHRERRRDGMRCLIVELRDTEVDELVRRGLLESEMRSDNDAVLQAFYLFLDGLLD